ncbi:MAG: hypothetical protein ACJ0DH_03350 [bacterium]
MLQPKLPTELTLLMQEIRNLGGQSFLVGGAVRDFLLNQKSKKTWMLRFLELGYRI